jgi:hypothetical protein
MVTGCARSSPVPRDAPAPAMLARFVVCTPGNGGKLSDIVLRLRAVIDNGDFEAYWAFHIHREHYRVHQASDQDRYDLIA